MEKYETGGEDDDRGPAVGWRIPVWSGTGNPGAYSRGRDAGLSAG